jgi:hypothetical protein
MRSFGGFRDGRRIGQPGSPARDPERSRGAIRTRQAVNWLTLGTPLGLAVARFGGATVEPGPHGVKVARGYRHRIPPVRNRAITIGDVVLLGLDDEELARRPELLVHEARHAGQYARCLGPVGFLPAYGLASLWSWWTTGTPALRNVFETRAGLIDGGYCARPDGE